MNVQLSRTKIDSFLGNVVCLRLCADTPLTEADVQWRADSDIVRIRDFRNAGEFSLNDGILLSLEKCGENDIPTEVYDLIESIQLDFFSDKYLPELAYYKAMARYKRGDKAGALEILDAFEAKVNDGFSHTDSGWFAAYALLISYPDLAPDARKSYYGRLAAFCKDAREKIN